MAEERKIDRESTLDPEEQRSWEVILKVNVKKLVEAQKHIRNACRALGLDPRKYLSKKVDILSAMPPGKAAVTFLKGRTTTEMLESELIEELADAGVSENSGQNGGPHAAIKSGITRYVQDGFLFRDEERGIIGLTREGRDYE